MGVFGLRKRKREKKKNTEINEYLEKLIVF
jgi:hypothetical protein